MDSTGTATSLLERLQTTTASHDLHTRISSYLRPILDFKHKNPPDTSSLRPLAKQFLEFICKALHLLPSLLQNKFGVVSNGERDEVEVLLRIYELVLDCLQTLSPCLHPKPYEMLSHRLRYIRFLEACSKYGKSESEATRLLEDLRSVLISASKEGRSSCLDAKYKLPDPKTIGTDDPEITRLLLGIVLCLTNCAYQSKSNNSDSYRRILVLVEQVQPWIQILNKEASRKNRMDLSKVLYRCAIFIICEFKSLDSDIVNDFCVMALKECSKGSLDQLPIYARKICSRIESINTLFLNVLRVATELFICEYKVQMNEEVGEFLDFISYCSGKLCGADMDKCERASNILNQNIHGFYKISPPFASILSLYSIGLHIKSYTPFTQINNDIPISSCYRILNDQETLQKLTKSLQTLSSYSYQCDSMEFICEVLVPCVKSVWKNFSSEGVIYSNYCKMSYFLKVLRHFSKAIVKSLMFENITEIEKERILSEKIKALLEAIVCELRICFLINEPYEDSSIRYVLLSDWITSPYLKPLISVFHNTGTVLYDIGHVEQVPVALNLCCKAIWANIQHVTKHSAKSKDIIKDTILDSYKRIALIIDTLHRCNAKNMDHITVRTLFELSSLEDLHGSQSSCFVLVKQWVKVLCKDYTSGDKINNAPILFELLTKYSSKWPKKAIQKILEEELKAYASMEIQGPSLCKKMQEKVSKILLNELCSSKNHPFERSRVLLMKARALRCGGIEGLNGSLDCLSQAISLLKGMISDSSKVDASVYHHLAIMYCLHAQCAQELNLEFTVILQDISSALDLWLGINIDDINSIANNILSLLYSIIDLLSIKGYFEFHSDICKLMAAIFKNENIPLERLFGLLWTERRLGHTICGSRIDMNLISDSFKNFGIDATLTGFWTNCLESNNPFNSTFLENLLPNHQVFSQTNKTCFKKRTEQVKSVASSMACESNLSSRFIAGYLYYDLSQRLLSEGQFVEALYYAREAYHLRMRLLRRKFLYSQTKPDEIQIQVLGPVMTETWLDSNKPSKITDSFLSPWIVLRSCLESILQVGSIHESTGNCVEAECKFKTGKEISRLEGLHSFEIIFATSLCNMYRKRHLWDMAQTEIKSARKLLEEIDEMISCKNCKIFLETMIDTESGDLSHALSNIEDGLRTYRSAFEKLDRFELQFPFAESKMDGDNKDSTCKICAVLNQDSSPKQKKTSRASKNALKDLNPSEVVPVRITRARAKKSQNDIIEIDCEPVNKSTGLKKTRKKANSDSLDKSDNKIVCWGCMMIKANSCSSMQSSLHFEVEFKRRSYLLSLLLKIARSLRAHSGKNEIHEIHEIYWKYISLLICSRPISGLSIGIHGDQLIEIIANENLGKTLAIERSLILYNVSFLILRNGFSKESRGACCSFSNIKISSLMTWLLRAFILSQALPELHRKVSRLIACSFLISTMDNSISMPLHRNKSLSLNHWASFFHQASIGASLDTHYQCTLRGEDGEKMAEAASKLPRVSYENIEQLEAHVANFFENLPNIPIICMSILGGDLAYHLGETLLLPSFYPAWIILSRLDSTNEPFTMLLPVKKVQKEDGGCIKEITKTNDESVKGWKCPWDHSIVDDVAPSFKQLLEENYLSALDTSDKNKFWSSRIRIDESLDKLLKDIEELWFGPWGFLLKGESINHKNIKDLNSRLGTEINPILVKAILCGAKSHDNAKACLSQLVSYKGYFGQGNYCENDRFKAFSSSRDISSELPEFFSGGTVETVNRDPVIFVLDNDIQMLPWENLPSLRSREIYRMPSVRSILTTLSRNTRRYKEMDGSSSCFPLANPFNAYYLLNPGGDLPDAQGEFEPIFKKHNWEGQSGDAPSCEELGLALKNHDLFLYIGHGDGSKYIPNREIEKLETCAAACLIGCSSGSLSCQANYTPKGAALSYIFAGSPAIIGNLWDVTNVDIDLFSKSMLRSWFRDSLECTRCSQLDARRKRCEECNAKRIATCMGKARDACKLKMLNGAAPVCYGVPTIIERKTRQG